MTLTNVSVRFKWRKVTFVSWKKFDMETNKEIKTLQHELEGNKKNPDSHYALENLC